MDTTEFERMLARHPGEEQGRMLHNPGLRAAGRCYAVAIPRRPGGQAAAARVAALIVVTTARDGKISYNRFTFDRTPFTGFRQRQGRG